jgi:hypothetical protein
MAACSAYRFWLASMYACEGIVIVMPAVPFTGTDVYVIVGIGTSAVAIRLAIIDMAKVEKIHTATVAIIDDVVFLNAVEKED